MNDLWDRMNHCLRALSAGGEGLDELAALIAEGRRREEERDALLREITLVLSCAQPGRVLDLILDALVRLSGAERAFILRCRDDGATDIVAARHSRRERVGAPEQEISRRVVAEVLEQGRTVRLEDARHTPPYSLSGSVARLKILSVVCAPIRADGRCIGLIYLENRRLAGVFSAETERVVSEFAARVGPALEQTTAFVARGSLSAGVRGALRAMEIAGLIGRSPAFVDCLRTAAIAADSDLPILIEGESGVGKEVVARAVHRLSPRAQGPFVCVNCAAVPSGILESELFGHRRGAFTGAVQDRRGLFAAAAGGTLFLDEIGEMPVELQTKLLRALQSGEVRPLGSDRVERSDARIVAATVRRLAQDVEEGRFRRDLFFRIRGVHVTLPALRERREDLPLLIENFLARYAPAGRTFIVEDEARAALAAYDYPGNVRELETLVRRAILFARDGRIGLDALPPEVSRAAEGILRLPPRVPVTARDLAAAVNAARRRAAREVQRAFLLHALAAADGRPGEAARRAGMNRSQFARMLSQHGLTARRARPGSVALSDPAPTA